jgi:hypothetical protein
MAMVFMGSRWTTSWAALTNTGTVSEFMGEVATVCRSRRVLVLRGIRTGVICIPSHLDIFGREPAEI